MNLNHEIRKPSSDYVPYNPKSYGRVKVPRNSMIMGHIGGIDQKPSNDERLSLGCGCTCSCGELSSQNTAYNTSFYPGVYMLVTFGYCGNDEGV